MISHTALLPLIQMAGIFLNIDCGSSLDSKDPITTLPWYVDSSYISAGESSSNVLTWDGYPQLKTLRFFNDTRFPKYCYKLPVASTAIYMLRTEFYYGTYDGGNTAPSFQMTIDGLVVANVTSTLTGGYYYETTYVAKGNTTFLCLLRDETNTNPYISTISLRRVTAYPVMNDFHLSKGFVANTIDRYSLGSSKTPRSVCMDLHSSALLNNLGHFHFHFHFVSEIPSHEIGLD